MVPSTRTALSHPCQKLRTGSQGSPVFRISSLCLGSEPLGLSLWQRSSQAAQRVISRKRSLFSLWSLPGHPHLLLGPFLHGHESGSAQICGHIDRFFPALGGNGSGWRGHEIGSLDFLEGECVLQIGKSCGCRGKHLQCVGGPGCEIQDRGWVMLKNRGRVPSS